MADMDACFNMVESAETPLQLNIAAAETNTLDVLIPEVLKNIEEEKNSGRKFSPSPSFPQATSRVICRTKHSVIAMAN